MSEERPVFIEPVEEQLEEEAARKKHQVDRFFNAVNRVGSVRNSVFDEDRERAMNEFLAVIRQML